MSIDDRTPHLREIVERAIRVSTDGSKTTYEVVA